MKSILRVLFRLPALIIVAFYRLNRAILGEERAFLGLAERLAKSGGYAGVYLRAATYHRVLERSSEEVQIGFGTLLSKRTAILEEHVYVGRYCSLGWVHLERDVMLADLVAIPSGGGTHQLSGTTRTPPRMAKSRFQPVRVGEGTWVGTHAVILADVGRFCIIGAGAVVTKPIPDCSIAVGVPARVVGRTDAHDAEIRKNGGATAPS